MYYTHRISTILLYNILTESVLYFCTIHLQNLEIIRLFSSSPQVGFQITTLNSKESVNQAVTDQPLVEEDVEHFVSTEVTEVQHCC